MQFFSNIGRKLLSALALSAIAVAPAQAGLFDFDPAPSGAYVSGFGGISFGTTPLFEGVQDPVAGAPGAAGDPANILLDLGSDRTFGGAIGYQLPFKYWSIFHPRLEIEAASFRQGVDGGSFNGGTQTFSGQVRGTSILLNNYSDIVWREDQVIVPYIGGGIGVVFFEADVVYFGPPTAPGLFNEDTALYGTFAAGLSWRFSPSLDLYTEARVSRATNVQLERSFSDVGGQNLFSADVTDSINNVSVIGGVRFRF